MSLKKEIFNLLKQDWLTQQEPMDYRLDIQAVRIVELFEKRIDSMIEIDNQTLNRKSYTVYDEGRIAAQASKNTLILVKEMLK